MPSCQGSQRTVDEDAAQVLEKLLTSVLLQVEIKQVWIFVDEARVDVTRYELRIL